MDTVRIGSFMAIQLRDEDDSKDFTIARLEEREQDEEQDPDLAATSIRLRLFLPLFTDRRLKWHPAPPSHNYEKIEHGQCGSRNKELYESTEVLWINGELPDKKVKLLFPAFVFTLEEMRKNENAWAEGMNNVYVVRFWHHTVYSYKRATEHRLDELPSMVSMGFVNMHPSYRHPDNLIVPRRCLHRTIWVGLYNLRKKLEKEIKNRGSSKVSSHGEVTLRVGYYLPVECIQYIHTLGNSEVSRQKLNMSYGGGVLIFENEEDLSYLNFLVGGQQDGTSCLVAASTVLPDRSISEKATKRGLLHVTDMSGKENTKYDENKDDDIKRRCDSRERGAEKERERQ